MGEKKWDGNQLDLRWRMIMRVTIGHNDGRETKGWRRMNQLESGGFESESKKCRWPQVRHLA